MKTKSCSHGRGVDSFLARPGADVTGVIAGYDRIRLRGSLRYRYQPSFMFRYLCEAGVKLKDFAAFRVRSAEFLRLLRLIAANPIGCSNDPDEDPDQSG